MSKSSIKTTKMISSNQPKSEIMYDIAKILYGGKKSDSDNKNDSNDELTTKDIFRLIDLHFYRENYLFRHLYNSYNKFIEEDIVNFLLYGQHIFSESTSKEYNYRHRFQYSNIVIEEPKKTNNIEPLFPSDARHDSLTYSVKILADVVQYLDQTQIASDMKNTIQIGTEIKNHHIATIPLMVKSKWCSLVRHKNVDLYEDEFDAGGYFIVNGNEKVIISQDKMAENKPLVLQKKESGTSTLIVQVNSRSHNPHGLTQVLHVKLKKDNVMNIKAPILNEINVCTVFRALGLESDRDIINYITYDEHDAEMVDLVRISLDACKNDKNQKINTQEEALDYLINKMREVKQYSEDKEERKKQQKLRLETLFVNNFIPHVEGDMKKKAYYLGYMCNRLLRVYLKRIPLDDRDSYVNKRIDVAGDLMFELFKQQYKMMIGDCKKYFETRNKSDEQPINIISNIKPNIIEQGFKTALSTGHWIRRQGVAQVLNRLSYGQPIAFLRRIDAPSGDASRSKLTSPRFLHPSSIGFICPIQTPEHANVGLTKHLTLIGTISVMSRDQTLMLKDYLLKNTINVKNINYQILRNENMFKVFLNGDWIGLTDKYIDLYTKLQDMKIKNKIDNQNVSIVLDVDENEIRIYTDSGRLVRPTLRVEENELLLKKTHIEQISLNPVNKNNKLTNWDEFINKYPVVEYIDMELQPYILIADKIQLVYNMRKKMINSIELSKNININSFNVQNRYDDLFYTKYTHCELHPSLLIGEVLTNKPFFDHNMGTRGIFAYSQSKQALGLYATNYRRRLDISYISYYPQKQLVSTRTAKYTNMEVMSSGENCVVAIACYTGYNQEDSLIINKTAVECGKFSAMSLKKYIAQVQKNHSTSEDDKFMKPDPTKVINPKLGAYDKLNEHGYAPEETVLENGDVIFGMVTHVQNPAETGKPFRDKSEIYKSYVKGTVDRVYPNIYNNEGYLTMKALVRSERIPNIGDKFACYTSDHEVLTTDGWVNITQITKNHKIASLHNGNELKYVNPIEIQAYDFDPKEELYHVKSNQVDLVVTKNHRMWTSRKDSNDNFTIREAQDIYGIRRKYMKNVKIWNPDNPSDTFTIKGLDDVSMFKKSKREEMKKDLVLPMNDWLMFFGIWMAEGCSRYGGVSFSAHKQRVKDVLSKALDNMNIHYTTQKTFENDDIRHIWEISDKRLTKFMTPLSVGAINKYLPDWVWNLTQEQCRILIEAMLLGDGHYIKGSTTYRYDTSSTRLADDFQRLCLHAGYASNKTLKYEKGHSSYILSGRNEGRLVKQNADSWRLSVIKTQCYPQVNKYIKPNGEGRCDNYITFESDELKDCIKNKVYCCSVAGNGVIYVRRNGITVWSGNSCAGQKGTIGILLDKCDMPYTEDGIVPDLILNPQAIPSRMTIGQLREGLIGKVAALLGYDADGTSFEGYDWDSVEDALEKLGYDRTGHEYMYNGMTGEKMKVKIFITPTYYQRLKHMTSDKVHCLNSKTTQILTRKGWKWSHELTKDDEIATLNNNVLVYEKPKNIFKYPNYKGKMYRIKNSNINLDVTMNHRMWVSKKVYKNNKSEWGPYDWELAENIVGKERRYKKDAEWNNPIYQFKLPRYVDGNNKVYEEKIVDMDSWLTFFGIWIAEGWSNKNRIQISINKQRVKDALYPAVTKLGYKYNISKDEKLSINNCQLASYMNQYSVGAPNKYLPDWAFELSKEQAQLLIKSIQLGDGSFNRTTNASRYYTSSEKLADDFQRLCLHAGWGCNKQIHFEAGKGHGIIDGREVINHNNIWYLSVIKSKTNPTVNHSHVSKQKIQEETTYDFEGEVFCVEVSSGVFMIRADGKPCWTGNSRARGPKTNLTRQAPEGRSKDGGFRLGEMERDALIAHGISMMIKEKTIDDSDAYIVHICNKCGLIAQRYDRKENKAYPSESDIYYCPSCDNNFDVSKIRTSYAFKLLIQELMTMSIAVRLRCE